MNLMGANMIIVITVYVAGIFLIGLPMGKKSLRIWEKDFRLGGGSGGFWGHMLFPLSSWGKGVGRSRDLPLMDEVDFDNKESRQQYIGLTGILWPIRLLWDVFILIICGLVFLICTITVSIARQLGKV